MSQYAIVEDIQPDRRFLYKRVPNCESDGCHLDIWLPKDGAERPPLAM